jgi:hypothetical protein
MIVLKRGGTINVVLRFVLEFRLGVVELGEWIVGWVCLVWFCVGVGFIFVEMR